MGCFAHIRRKLVEVMDVAPHTPKKSHLDTAMTYAINNEKYLRYYIEDGRVEISNNSAERCCKSFVIKPYEYIEYILTRMTGNKLTTDLLEKIMPWSEELPKNLYKNKKA